MRKFLEVRTFRFIALACLILLALALPPPAYSQGCSLCYTQAASASARLIRALKSGIFVLVLPPLCLLGIFARLTYLRRNYFGSSLSADDSAIDPARNH